ncbi:unnamed protein product [Lepeophtheirus salmonis]|uniref:(salmon louse) hypothetical protein n=1 Tax=Lepeophtheirus salmonis TaxID=72036 RepID=A0A7R8H1Y9_LEPSM|nr:unnamed protein product [Lepeophtheirus salmonis]CAF2803892.1 unnamed protein product [Lepeophtheirus salmonis]
MGSSYKPPPFLRSAPHPSRTTRSLGRGTSSQWKNHYANVAKLWGSQNMTSTIPSESMSKGELWQEPHKQEEEVWIDPLSLPQDITTATLRRKEIPREWFHLPQGVEPPSVTDLLKESSSDEEGVSSSELHHSRICGRGRSRIVGTKEPVVPNPAIIKHPQKTPRLLSKTTNSSCTTPPPPPRTSSTHKGSSKKVIDDGGYEPVGRALESFKKLTDKDCSTAPSREPVGRSLESLNKPTDKDCIVTQSSSINNNSISKIYEELPTSVEGVIDLPFTKGGACISYKDFVIVKSVSEEAIAILPLQDITSELEDNEEDKEVIVNKQSHLSPDRKVEAELSKKEQRRLEKERIELERKERKEREKLAKEENDRFKKLKKDQEKAARLEQELEKLSTIEKSDSNEPDSNKVQPQSPEERSHTFFIMPTKEDAQIKKTKVLVDIKKMDTNVPNPFEDSFITQPSLIKEQKHSSSRVKPPFISQEEKAQTDMEKNKVNTLTKEPKSENKNGKSIIESPKTLQVSVEKSETEPKIFLDELSIGKSKIKSGKESEEKGQQRSEGKEMKSFQPFDENIQITKEKNPADPQKLAETPQEQRIHQPLVKAEEKKVDVIKTKAETDFDILFSGGPLVQKETTEPTFTLPSPPFSNGCQITESMKKHAQNQIEKLLGDDDENRIEVIKESNPTQKYSDRKSSYQEYDEDQNLIYDPEDEKLAERFVGRYDHLLHEKMPESIAGEEVKLSKKERKEMKKLEKEKKKADKVDKEQTLKQEKLQAQMEKQNDCEGKEGFTFRG